MSIVDELKKSNLMGVAPPQNWTSRAIEKIEALEILLDQANRHKDGRGRALEKERAENKRLSTLLLEGIRIMENSHEIRGICPDHEHEWINKILNRDSSPPKESKHG